MVALGQLYFAVQTRLQEIRQMDEYNPLDSEDEKRLFLRNELKKNNLQLVDAAKDAGVIEPIDYAIFQNHGYKGLYGALDAKGIHKRLKSSQNILDYMGSAELAATLFRATQTEEKLRRENIKGKQKANQMHYEVGKRYEKQLKKLEVLCPKIHQLLIELKCWGKMNLISRITKSKYNPIFYQQNDRPKNLSFCNNISNLGTKQVFLGEFLA